jgi:indoleamine 2,3-dioxygenase
VNIPSPDPAHQASQVLDFGRYQIDAERGFLPAVDPLRRLSGVYALWDEVAGDLPKLLAAAKLGWTIERLPVLDAAELTDDELRRAMLVLSFLGHGYVWETWRTAPRSSIPPALAVPWYQVAQRLGRPPVLSYASYALDNWRRIDPNGAITLGNVALLQNFLGGLDEEWFVAVHVDIEAKAAAVLAAIGSAQNAVARDESAILIAQLEAIATALGAMYTTLLRMPEGCDPYIYYNRVRPFIHGFSEHPVVYEGVAALGGVPQRFHGETGAQSSIIPALDAALGVAHEPDELRVYLTKMRDYMPPAHRAFLATVESGPSIRAYIQTRGPGHPELRNLYNACVLSVERFRAKHLEYAASYIHQQSQKGANSTYYGTGGTPFMKYLKKHRDETGGHVITGG